MGHKVNPKIFRANTTFHFSSRWFATPALYAAVLQKDVCVRKYLRERFRDAAVALIEIECATDEMTIIIHTAKPGMIIGRGGVVIEEVKAAIKRKFFGSVKMKITINIQEVPHADSVSELILQNIRDQLEKRIPFRRAIKRAMEQVINADSVKGCKIQVSGRLNGAEIARQETIGNGRLPLHTLRANIDYARGVARTIYGIIGIKVWIYKGDVFGDEESTEEVKKPVAAEFRPASRRRKRLETGGQQMILRKKSDIEKEIHEQPSQAQAS